MNDLRIPTGFFFTLIGVLLLLYALINPGARAPLTTDLNVNLWCGLSLVIFGGCLLWLARRARS